MSLSIAVAYWIRLTTSIVSFFWLLFPLALSRVLIFYFLIIFLIFLYIIFFSTLSTSSPLVTFKPLATAELVWSPRNFEVSLFGSAGCVISTFRFQCQKRTPFNPLLGCRINFCTLRDWVRKKHKYPFWWRAGAWVRLLTLHARCAVSLLQLLSVEVLSSKIGALSLSFSLTQS